MRLTETDKKMLRGDYGEVKKLALEKIIKYAKVYGADELCDVTKSTSCYDTMDGFLEQEATFDAAYSKAYLGKEIELDSIVAPGCLCQDDVCSVAGNHFEAFNQSPEYVSRILNYLDRAQELGVLRVSTCAPYLTGWIPLMGEVFVTTESSNVLFCNSVWGARGNSGGQATTFLSTITGRTPKAGMLIDENRKGTAIFHVECRTKTRMDWDLLGYVLGTFMQQGGVPVLADGFERPDIVKLKSFFSTLATTSGTELCLIVGVSPEAQTIEGAMKGNKADMEITITQDMIDKTIKKLCHPKSGPVDLVQIGCPHCGIEELVEYAKYMKGKKVKDGVKLFIYTTPPTYRMAEDNGITKIFEESGVYLTTNGCVNVTAHMLDGKKAIGLSSAKLTHYQQSQLEIPIYYGSDKECLDASIKGYWEVK